MNSEKIVRLFLRRDTYGIVNESASILHGHIDKAKLSTLNS